MAEEHEQDRYEHLFKQFSDQVERWLLRLICVAAALLIIVQGLLQVPSVRAVLTRVDVLEGEPYNPPAHESRELR